MVDLTTGKTSTLSGPSLPVLVKFKFMEAKEVVVSVESSTLGQARTLACRH